MTKYFHWSHHNLIKSIFGETMEMGWWFENVKQTSKRQNQTFHSEIWIHGHKNVPRGICAHRHGTLLQDISISVNLNQGSRKMKSTYMLHALLSYACDQFDNSLQSKYKNSPKNWKLKFFPTVDFKFISYWFIEIKWHYTNC